MRLALLLLLVCSAVQAGQLYGPYACALDGPVQDAVVDGDTIKVVCDIWPGLEARTSVRVEGIDTPELHSPQCEAERIKAAQAKARVIEWLGGSRLVEIFEVEPDKYGGRVVARVRLEEGAPDLSTVLLGESWAHPYDGKAKTGWCK